MSSVRIDAADAVAVVTIDNPPVNALGEAVLEQLTGAAAALAADDSVRAVVLTGAGERAFAAGADLAEFAALLEAGEGIEQHTTLTRSMFELWETLPQPVVAAVQASAVGGGLELALVCDLVVADPAARFGAPEVRLGLIPGAGGTQRLPRRIGPGPARELLLLGRTIDAARAHALGLVTRVAAPGAALAEAHALATELAALPARAVQAAKRAAAGALGGDLGAGLDRERELFHELFAGEDVREGVAALREKREPRFRHR